MKYWWRCRETYAADGNIKWYNHFEKQFDSFFKKIKFIPIIWSDFAFPGICPREKVTYFERLVHDYLFVIANNWK